MLPFPGAKKSILPGGQARCEFTQKLLETIVKNETKLAWHIIIF